MAKVLTFSRVFPSYHPRKGEPTGFVEKIWEALEIYPEHDERLTDEVHNRYLGPDYLPKIHTIRAGNRWKTGDMASLRVWSGVPYYSKQIIIGPDIKLPRVSDVEIDRWGKVFIDGRLCSVSDIEELAHNDGLSTNDFWDWFIKLSFKGQLIFLTEANTPY